MALYSEAVMDQFMHPRNVGIIEDADGVGEVGNAKCGDIMKIYLKIENDVIVDVKFETFGCGSAIASSSMATEMIKGKSIHEAMTLTNKAVAEALDGLPAHKLHCSVLAEQAILSALKKLRKAKNMNAYMRMNAAKRLLGMLKLTSGLNNTVVDAALTALTAADIPEWSWMNPREEVDRSAEAAAMRNAVDKLDPETLERSIRFHRAFYEAALSRILHPAAIVSLQGGEQIIPFRDAAASEELWSLDRLPGGDFIIRIFAKQDRKTGTFRKLKSAGKAFHGMVLFSPDDREDTRALQEKLIKTFSGPGETISPVDYPIRWPANFMDES